MKNILIAAAPELLEACHDAADFYHDRSGQEEVCTEESPCLWCKVIAKAEGKIV